MFPVFHRLIGISAALALASATAASHAQGSSPERRDAANRASLRAATPAPPAALTAPGPVLSVAATPARAVAAASASAAPPIAAPAPDPQRAGSGRAAGPVHVHPPAPRVVQVSHPHRPHGHRPAIVHTHGPSVRVWVGPPPVYYPSPYWVQPVPAPYVYRPSPWVIVPPAPPPVYIERPDSAPDRAPSSAEAPPQAYWYWCDSRAAYHPSAPDCPEGWIAAPPRPAGMQ